MTRPSRSGPALMLALVLAATALPSAPAWAQAEAEAKPAVEPTPTALGELKVRFRSSGGDNVAGAILRLYHLETGDTVSSEASGRSGQTELTAIPHGYYDIAVETSEGLFLMGEVLNIGPKSKSTWILTLVPDADRSAEATQRRTYLGEGDKGAGLAQLKVKPRGAAFWKSTKGIVILAAAGSAALFAVALDDNTDELNASPSSP